MCVCFLTRNMLQLVQRAEMDEEEGRLVMPSVKPDDAGDQTIDMYCDQTYIATRDTYIVTRHT